MRTISLMRGPFQLCDACYAMVMEAHLVDDHNVASDHEAAPLEMCSVLKRLNSDGLRRTILDSQTSEQALQIRGTAFVVVELLVHESSPRTLHIIGDSAAKWQFSMSRLPEDSRGSTEGILAKNDR